MWTKKQYQKYIKENRTKIRAYKKEWMRRKRACVSTGHIDIQIGKKKLAFRSEYINGNPVKKAPKEKDYMWYLEQQRKKVPKVFHCVYKKV